MNMAALWDLCSTLVSSREGGGIVWVREGEGIVWHKGSIERESCRGGADDLQCADWFVDEDHITKALV